MHFEGMHGYIVNRKWDGARGGPFGVKSLSLTIGSILKRRRFLARHFGSFSLRLHSLSAKIKRARIRALFILATQTEFAQTIQIVLPNLIHHCKKRNPSR